MRMMMRMRCRGEVRGERWEARGGRREVGGERMQVR